MATTDAVRLRVTRYLQALAADQRDHETLRLNSRDVAKELKLPAVATRQVMSALGEGFGLEKLPRPSGGATITEFNFHPAQMKAGSGKTPRVVRNRGLRARVLDYLQRQDPGTVLTVNKVKEDMGTESSPVRAALLYFAKLNDFDVSQVTTNVYRVGQIGQSANGHGRFVVDHPPETQPGRAGKDAAYDKAMAAEFAVAERLAGQAVAVADKAAAAEFDKAVAEIDAAFQPEPESVQAGSGTPPHMLARVQQLAPWEAPAGWTVRYLTTTSAGVVLVEDGSGQVYALHPVKLG